MELKATLETKISKTGNPYDVIVIKLTEDYEKLVFLEKAETALVKQARVNNKDSELEMPDFLS